MSAQVEQAPKAETKTESKAIDFSVPHPLQNRWCMWYAFTVMPALVFKSYFNDLLPGTMPRKPARTGRTSCKRSIPLPPSRTFGGTKSAIHRDVFVCVIHVFSVANQIGEQPCTAIEASDLV
jgi:hypothetical protein